MTKPPAFQFYASDFRAAPEVMAMSFEERGVYVWLLTVAWDEEGIPADLEKVRKLLPGISKRKLDSIWPSLEPCWESDGNGKLVNPRMERVRATQREHSKARSEAGKRGAKARWN